jgi:signal transduction histidine kinase
VGHAALLERQVQELTAELAKRNEEMRAFAHGMSHDLRAPLRAMQGFGQALLEDYGDTLDEVARDFITRIVEAAAHMDGLIEGLAEYSRLVQSQIRLERVSMREAIEAALSEVDSEISARKARISIPRNDVQIMGHLPTLTRVAANLISNGVKFSREGIVPSLDIRLSESEGLGRMTVKDNGIGVGPEYHERIFRLFERLQPMEKYPGSGVGLAIAKRSVELMGGNIGVEPVVGKGSVFWFELPLA